MSIGVKYGQCDHLDIKICRVLAAPPVVPGGDQFLVYSAPVHILASSPIISYGIVDHQSPQEVTGPSTNPREPRLSLPVATATCCCFALARLSFALLFVLPLVLTLLALF